MNRHHLALALLALFTTIAPAARAAAPLKVGDLLPELRGEFLSGRRATLPDSAHGRVALLALGFSRDSQQAVEAWSNRFRKDFGSDPRVAFYEIPVIGGLGRLARPFINSGMRRGTPPALHENVITVYGDVGDWKDRLGYSEGLFAYLLLLDPSGRIVWQHAGLLDDASYRSLAEVMKQRMALHEQPGGP